MVSKLQKEKIEQLQKIPIQVTFLLGKACRTLQVKLNLY